MSDRKEWQNSLEKGHVWKESGITTQGTRDVEAGILLLRNNKKIILLIKD